MIKSIILLLIVGVLVTSCSVSRVIVPLAENQKVVSVSAGGPLVKFENATAPIPLSSISYSYGVKKNLTWTSSIQTTSLAFGVLHFETGVLSNIFYHNKSKLAMSYSPSLAFMSDIFEWNSRIYPQLDLNLYYYLIGSGGRDCNCPGSGSVKTPLILYTGVSNLFELNGTRTLGTEQDGQFFANPHFGFLLKGKGWRFQAETKYLMSTIDNTGLVVDYAGFNNKGAVGTYFSYYKTIGRGR